MALPRRVKTILWQLLAFKNLLIIIVTPLVLLPLILDIGTRDTVLALQSQSEFAQKVFDSNPISIDVKVKSTAPDYMNDFTTITNENAIIMQLDDVPAGVTSLEITAKGTGNALFQANWQYNTEEMENTVPNNPNLIVTVEYKKQTENRIEVESCVHYKGKKPVGMSLLEIETPSGFEADLTSLEGQPGIKKTETKAGNAVLYLDEVTETKLCPRIVANKIFAVTDYKRTAASISSYYNPEMISTAFYQVESKSAISVCDICIENCPAKCETTGAQQVTFTFTTLLSIVIISLSLKHMLYA